MKRLQVFVGFGAILLATGLYFLFTRSAYDDVVNCMMSDTRWEYGDIHWTADETGVVIFVSGWRSGSNTPVTETVYIPLDGGTVTVTPGIDAEAAVAQYGLALGARAGWDAQMARYAFGQADAQTGTRQIYVVARDTPDTAQQLTSGAYDAGRAQWSPDGQWVAYLTNRTQVAADGVLDSAWGVMAVSADGQDERLLTVLTDETDVTWAPDSERVLYYGGGGTYAVGLDAGTPQFLIDGRFPVWSPSGERLVYLSPDGCDPRVLVADADGENARTVHRFRHTQDGR